MGQQIKFVAFKILCGRYFIVSNLHRKKPRNKELKYLTQGDSAILLQKLYIYPTTWATLSIYKTKHSVNVI